MQKHFPFFCVLVVLLLCPLGVFGSSTVIKSINGKIELKIWLVPEGPLFYSVNYEGKPVIALSRLNLKFKGLPELKTYFVDKAERGGTGKADWEYPWGRQRFPGGDGDIYEYAIVHLREHPREHPKKGRTLGVEFRVYNDGVAFRYLIDEKTFEQGVFNLLEKDLTEFNFPNDSTAWFADFGSFNSSQEKPYLKKRLSDIKPGAHVGCPLVVQSSEKGPYVALTEAELNWGGLYFEGQAVTEGQTGIKLQATLSPRHDGKGLAVCKACDPTPWRVIIIAPKAINLVDQTIVMNLSEPTLKADWSWVKPGIATWDWWSDSNANMKTETVKKFIDFASEMGWQYHFLDDPWYAGKKYKMGDPRNNVLKGSGDIDIEELVRYGKEKNVRLFLWLHWKDIDRQMDEAFAQYEKWGIAGVKIDFMDRDDQEMVWWYDKTVKKAAEHHLLVNFHGAFKPTGYRRTMPNLITREGIMGNEYNKWSKLSAEHYCTLPYTRLMLGPGDFTSGAFLNRNFPGDKKVEGARTAQGIGTRAHELAISLLYDSPILCMCDRPENYRGQPGIEFYRDLPTVWDKSIGVEGEIGEYFSLIRRKGNDWYYGAITDGKERKLELPLKFLGEGNYEATIYSDTEETKTDARKIHIETKAVKSTDTLSIKMAPGGGQVIVFKKK
jgi:alpha-glucosidase